MTKKLALSAICLPSALSATPSLSHISNRKKRNPGEEIVTSPKMRNLRISSFSFVSISPCPRELSRAPLPWMMPVGRGGGQAHRWLFLCSQAQPLLRDTLAQAPGHQPGPSPAFAATCLAQQRASEFNILGKEHLHNHQGFFFSFQ